jgi:hypothetical protein
MPFASTHVPSSFAEPALIKMGLGAQSATSSWASTGRSFTVRGPAYFIKFGANQ